jgi:hypothetical protein
MNTEQRRQIVDEVLKKKLPVHEALIEIIVKQNEIIHKEKSRDDTESK